MSHDKEVQMTQCSISHITIQNYKGIEHLAIDFSNFGILGIAGAHGTGKTSILECCALLLHFKDYQYDIVFNSDSLLYSCIRAGQEYAKIEGTLINNNATKAIKLMITKTKILLCFNQNTVPQSVNQFFNPDTLKSIFGHFPEPHVEESMILFHSHRKIKENALSIGDLLGKTPKNLGIIKRIVLQSLLSQAKDILEINFSSSLDALFNEILKEFANCRIGKIRPHKNNEIELLVEHLQSPNGFSFDFLSAGQKEIISTLFLIIANKPSVVLIDTPELHLNTDYCSRMISFLKDKLPNSQYIITTNHENIMDLTSIHNRLYLTQGGSHGFIKLGK